MKQLNNKQKLIVQLRNAIKQIEKRDDSLDVSCMIIQQQNGEYVIDIHEYL